MLSPTGARPRAAQAGSSGVSPAAIDDKQFHFTSEIVPFRDEFSGVAISVKTPKPFGVLVSTFEEKQRLGTAGSDLSTDRPDSIASGSP